MKTLQAVGWNWRTDGVEVCATVDGKRYQIFVPLAAVHHEFAKAFQEAGTPLPSNVGRPLSVDGLFESMAHAARNQPAAVGWFGSSIVHAVTKAASSVTQAALKPVAGVVNTATHALSSVPVLGGALSAATTALTSPINAVNSLVNGGRISNVAMNALKSNIASMRTLAPYAQTVISVVPGVGQGLSGAIGAGLALASGMSVSDAVMAGVRDSLPGGPLAKAAFDVAAAAAQGKSISQVALAALPLTNVQKYDLMQGVNLARDLASGKNVSQAIVDRALTALPPEAQKAVQIAVALSHAKNLQSAVAGVAQASGVAQQLASGVAAAQQIASLPRSLSAPPHLVQAVQQGLAAKQLVQQATNAAAQGHAPSAAFLSFLNKPHISGPLPKAFQARFHTGPAHPQHRGGSAQHHHRGGGGIHNRTRVGAPVAPVMKTFTARFHTDPPAVSGPGGIHSRFGAVSGPWPTRPFSFMPRPVPQLYPVRMPYQTASRLHYAFGR